MCLITGVGERMAGHLWVLEMHTQGITTLAPAWAAGLALVPGCFV